MWDINIFDHRLYSPTIRVIFSLLSEHFVIWNYSENLILEHCRKNNEKKGGLEEVGDNLFLNKSTSQCHREGEGLASPLHYEN